MIDLLVVNYNSCSYLTRLVNTLYASTPDLTNRQWRLFVQDNDSKDDSVEWINEHKDLFDVVQFSSNVGYAKAINSLALRGNSDILVALNADVWFTNDDLLSVQNRFDSDLTISILGPKQRNEQGMITHGGILDFDSRPKHRGWMELDPADTKYRFVEDMGTVSGSAYFVRRDVWNYLAACPIYKSIDPTSEGAFLQTPHYYEESFMSSHARAHGYRVVYDGTISIGHTWHASSPINGPADQNFLVSREMFINACKVHNIKNEFS